VINASVYWRPSRKEIPVHKFNLLRHTIGTVADIVPAAMIFRTGADEPFGKIDNERFEAYPAPVPAQKLAGLQNITFGHYGLDNCHLTLFIHVPSSFNRWR
jgi:hypothetical protein